MGTYIGKATFGWVPTCWPLQFPRWAPPQVAIVPKSKPNRQLTCGAHLGVESQQRWAASTQGETQMSTKFDYGLDLTNNSKVGWAFSLPRSKTCVNATNICKRLCYGNGIRYQSAGQKSKKERNFRTAEFLLREGGPELLFQNLCTVVEQARPRDWLTAQITGRQTVIPWTLRIHDVGDFYSVDYVRAWFLTVQKYAGCKFWFYTRSFLDVELFEALSSLAALPNCQGLLSIDSDNFEQAIIAKCKSPAGVWNMALLQDSVLNSNLVPALSAIEDSVDIVNFPYHRSGRHVAPLRSKLLTNCPAVVGGLSLKASKDSLRPCQSCTICLP